MEILVKIIVPLITAVLGFFGGCSYEKNKINQKIGRDNSGNMIGGDVKNVYKEK